MNNIGNLPTNNNIFPAAESQQGNFTMPLEEQTNNDSSLKVEGTESEERHEVKITNDIKSDEKMGKSSKEETEVLGSAQDECCPVSFPQKLMEMLDNEEHADVISWLPHGKGFRIHKKKTLANELLPKYFGHSKYASFTRRLNRWGFVRVSRGPEVGTYYHNLFIKGDAQSLLQMSCQQSARVRGGKPTAGDRFLLYRQQLGDTLPPTPQVSPATLPQCATSTVANTLHGQIQQLQYLQYQIQMLTQLHQQMKKAMEQQQGLHRKQQQYLQQQQQEQQLSANNATGAATTVNETHSDQHYVKELTKQLTLQEQLKKQLTIHLQQGQQELQTTQASLSARANASFGGGDSGSGATAFSLKPCSNTENSRQRQSLSAPSISNATSDAHWQHDEKLKELQRLYSRASSKSTSPPPTIDASFDSGISAPLQQGVNREKFITFSQLQKQEQQQQRATQGITSSKNSATSLKPDSNNLYAHQMLLMKQGSGTNAEQTKAVAGVSQQEHIVHLRKEKEEQNQANVTNHVKRASAA